MIDKNNAVYEKSGSHTTLNIPFARYFTVYPESGLSYPMHWHDDIEIVMCYCGQIKYTIDLVEYIISAGDILIIPPSSLHSFEMIDTQKYRAQTFIFNMSLLPECETITSILSGQKMIKPLIKPSDSGYSSIHDNLDKITRSLVDKDSDFELLLSSLLTHFLYLCTKHSLIINKDIELTTNAGYIKNVMEYIKEHYNRNLTLDELSDVCNLSPCHLSKTFKKVTGMTCFEYIIDFRLTKAYDALTNSDKSILDIAMENGFNNISYFNRAFKKKYSCTPKECRK